VKRGCSCRRGVLQAFFNAPHDNESEAHVEDRDDEAIQHGPRLLARDVHEGFVVQGIESYSVLHRRGARRDEYDIEAVERRGGGFSGSRENGVVGHWDDIVLIDAEALDQPLPYWVGNESNWKEAYVWRPVVSGTGQEDFDPALIGYPAIGWRPLTDVFSNGGQLRLRGQSVAQNMMYIYGVRQETAWGSDILATKRIDVPWATAALALAYYQRIKGQTVLDKNQDAAIVAQINWWRNEYNENDRRVRSFGRTQESPVTSWVYV